MLYGSIHVDPGAGWFPHFVGHADETGGGAGEGATLNLPLAEGTGDERVAGRRRATWRSGPTGSDALVVSLGRRRRRRRPGEPAARHRGRATARPAACSARSACPTVVVQEGGYHLPSLGGLVAAYLDGHAEP